MADERKVEAKSVHRNIHRAELCVPPLSSQAIDVTITWYWMNGEVHDNLTESDS